MKPKIVVKFGGSNLKTHEDILKVVNVIKLYKNPLVIIVSAFYGVTNLLTDIIVKATTDESHIIPFTESLSELNTKIINSNISNPDIRKATSEKAAQRLAELQKYLTGINYIGEVPEFIEDLILSYGERLSSLILTAVLADNGICSREALPEDMKLITNGEYHNSTVDFAVSEENVRKYLEEDCHFVVPGFY